MLYNEESVRANLRNRDGKRVFFLGRGDQLTSGARDFLNRERIDIRSGEQAKIEEYRLLNGGFLREKPEHMTHLRGDILVEKTHPVITFRGKMDTLQSALLLCQAENPDKKQALGEILELARSILGQEVLERPVQAVKLCELTEDEVRRRSHFPQEYYGQPHFVPSAADGRGLLLLNFARCMAREAELAAAGAFTNAEGNVTRGDIVRALNRMSSMLYLLMIEKKSQG